MVENRASSGVIAITWERHQRTRALCEGLGIPLHELTFSGSRLGRYWTLFWQTVRIIREARPRVVVVQNPSLVLALAAMLMRRFLGNYVLIVDAHNEAVEPYIHNKWPVPQIARLLLRNAQLTIVTNSRLQRIVESSGGRAFVLPDRLPHVPIEVTPPPAATAPMDVMVVSTYAPDEPIREILSAAAKLQGEFAFYVTGRDSKLSNDVRSTVPKNVTLTGFLSEQEYWELMRRCHLVLDLTLMPECLVCGAYESLALGRPLILSDSASSRELFAEVAVFSGSDPDSIVRALLEARSRYADLCARMEPARGVFCQHWDSAASELIGTWFTNVQARSTRI